MTKKKTTTKRYTPFQVALALASCEVATELTAICKELTGAAVKLRKGFVWNLRQLRNDERCLKSAKYRRAAVREIADAVFQRWLGSISKRTCIRKSVARIVESLDNCFTN